MNTRPRLSHSIPYWALIALSVISIAYGTWLTTDKLATMSSTLLDGTATGVEVYGGQAWVTFGAVFVVAGLVGLVLALALAAARTLVAPAAPMALAVSDDDAIAFTHDDGDVSVDDASAGHADLRDADDVDILEVEDDNAQSVDESAPVTR